MKPSLHNWLLASFFTICLILTIITLGSYAGKAYIYLLFSLSVNALLYYGLRKDSLFFDFYIGGLFWLGYWLKFSVRVAFYDGKFHESVGEFDYSGAAFDKALLVVIVGVSALLVVRILRAKYLFQYARHAPTGGLLGLQRLYYSHKAVIWSVFVALILAVSFSNAYFGFYQRGMAPRVILPFQLNGVFTWTLLFGAASCSTLMLNFEVNVRKAVPILLVFIVVLEIFCANLSMLSRGMVLNSGAILVGLWVALRVNSVTMKAGRMVAAVAMVLVLTAVSVGLVNYLRQHYFAGDRVGGGELDVTQLTGDSTILLIDRWVGMEGAMAVSSYHKLGWELLGRVWREQYRSQGSSLYDREISKMISKERNDWLVRNGLHFITVPGVLSFFYYSGSFVFLFCAMLVVGAIASGIEIATYKLSGSNLILCSLIAFLVAYRYAHFGYVPGRSYLLFGSIALNILTIYFANRFFVWKYARRS